MHSVIFVACPSPKNSSWHTFLSNSESKLSHAKGVQRLGENVWLLNLQESLEALGFLTAYAEEYGIEYGAIAFDAAPQWLPGGFDPTSIQVRSV